MHGPTNIRCWELFQSPMQFHAFAPSLSTDTTLPRLHGPLLILTDKTVTTAQRTTAASQFCSKYIWCVPFYPADTWQGAVCPVGGRNSDMAAIAFCSRCKIVCLSKKNRAAASDLQIQHRVIKYLQPKHSKRALHFNPPGFPKEHCFVETSQTSFSFS